jgi:hypothetical protein
MSEAQPTLEELEEENKTLLEEISTELTTSAESASAESAFYKFIERAVDKEGNNLALSMYKKVKKYADCKAKLWLWNNEFNKYLSEHPYRNIENISNYHASKIIMSPPVGPPEEYAMALLKEQSRLNAGRELYNMKGEIGNLLKPEQIKTKNDTHKKHLERAVQTHMTQQAKIVKEDGEKFQLNGNVARGLFIRHMLDKIKTREKNSDSNDILDFKTFLKTNPFFPELFIENFEEPDCGEPPYDPYIAERSINNSQFIMLNLEKKNRKEIRQKIGFVVVDFIFNILMKLKIEEFKNKNLEEFTIITETPAVREIHGSKPKIFHAIRYGSVLGSFITGKDIVTKDGGRTMNENYINFVSKVVKKYWWYDTNIRGPLQRLTSVGIALESAADIAAGLSNGGGNKRTKKYKQRKIKKTKRIRQKQKKL